MQGKSYVLFYVVFMALLISADSFAETTSADYEVSGKEQKVLWLKKVLLYGVLPATGIVAAIYGSLYLYNLTAKKALLANYYEKRFFGKTTIDPQGRCDLYQENTIGGELHVDNQVRMKLSSINIDDNCIEYATYRHAERGKKSAEHEYNVVYFGGAREDSGDIDEVLVKLVNETGIPVVAPNYPGYGFSTGKSSFDNNQKMANAFIDYYQRNNPNKKLILLGNSYGASVAIDGAFHHPDIDDLIIIGAYASAKKEGWDYAKWYEKPLIPFAIQEEKNNNIRLIQTMPSRSSGKQLKITSFHGKADETVPYSHQSVLSNAALLSKNVRFKRLGKYSASHLSMKPDSTGPIIATLNGIKQ